MAIECPACARENFDLATRCSTCTISFRAETSMELDPLVKEMWAAHARAQESIRKSVAFLAVMVLLLALLWLVGAFMTIEAINESGGSTYGF